MPANGRHPTAYLDKVGDPSLLNVATLYKAGELGQMYIDTANRGWQLVATDSGPATIVAGDLAFWKTKNIFKVTNKLADAVEGRNAIAGIFTTTVTPGNFTFIQDLGPSKVTVKTSGSPAVGDFSVANSGASSDSVGVSAGTAPGYLVLGIYSSVAAASLASVDLIVGSNAPTP